MSRFERRRGHTLPEVLVAAALGLIVLVAALLIQQRAAVTVDSSQRKMTAAAATDLALERLRHIVSSARRVWVPAAGSQLVRDQAARAGMAAPALLYADGLEILFDPAQGRLFIGGRPMPGIRLSSAEFTLVGEELAIVLAADEASASRSGRPPAWREQSVVCARLHLRVQSDAERYAHLPESSHSWCLAADALDYRNR